VTQAELELVARGVRAKGLHSSWDELLTFSEDAVGSLADAYQALLRSMAKSDTVSSIDPDDVQKVVKYKLVKALTILTSEAQLSRWESDALAENNVPRTQQMEYSGFEGNQA